MAQQKRNLKLLSLLLGLACTFISKINAEHSFRILNSGKGPWNELRYFQVIKEKKTQDIKLSFNHLDRSIVDHPYARGHSIYFSYAEDRVKFEASYRLKKEIQEQLKEPLLIFSRTVDSNPGFKITQIEDSIVHFPVNHATIVNTTASEISFLLGHDTLNLSPNASKRVNLNQLLHKEIVVQIFSLNATIPKKLYQKTWTFLPDYRYIIMLKRNQNKRLIVLQISEYLEPKIID